MEYLFLTPFVGQVDCLWPNSEHFLHLFWLPNLFLSFPFPFSFSFSFSFSLSFSFAFSFALLLLPPPSKKFLNLFFLCLPLDTFGHGGYITKPRSTLGHCDLSISG